MRNTRTRKYVGVALLAAIIVVLQTVASGIKIGQFTPTFSLIPIIIGAILYGPVAGIVLGLVFGVIVVAAVLSGAEAFSTMMLTQHPVVTVFTCLFKGAMAGFIPGLVYNALKDKNELLATAVSSVLAPVMNTGIFSIILLTVFGPLAEEVGASIGFENAAQFVLVGIIGLNFLVELGINVVLVPVVTRIIKAVA